MKRNLSPIRTDKEALLAELKLAGAEEIGKMIRCPFHEDHTPSGSVHQGEDGAWRFKCFGCGAAGDVFDLQARRTGRELGEILSGKEASPWEPPAAVPRAEKPARWFPSVEEIRAAEFPGKRIDAVYEYANPVTRTLELIVARYKNEAGGKSFFQFRPARGGFEMKAPDPPLPLFNRARVAKSQRVLVVEGEKCVLALHEIGIVATTSPGGSAAAAKADWSPLAGKTVYLWADNDEPGEKYMREVAGLCEKLSPAPRLFWIPAPEIGLPAKGDAADLLADRTGTTEEKRGVIEDVLSFALPMGPSGEIKRLLEMTISGQRRAIEFRRWGWLSFLSKAFFPGSVTLLCGAGGAAKSFLVLEAVIHWQPEIPVSLFALEEDRAFHLNRALALLAGDANLTDDVWLRTNGDRARELYEEHAATMDAIGRRIWTCETAGDVSLKNLIAWIEARAADGDRILIVDPVTAANEENRKPWEAARWFVTTAKRIATQRQCSILLVTHPRKGGVAGPVVDELAGGAAYIRFSSTVFWLERVEEKPTPVKDRYGMMAPMIINRIVHILKARLGKGQGMRVGFYFDPATLRSSEAGIIVGKDKKEK